MMNIKNKMRFAVLAALLPMAGCQSVHVNSQVDPEDWKQFKDAPGRFRLERMLPAANHGQLFWVDNDSVIFSTCSLPNGWKCSPAEHEKIIIEDIRTGRFKDTGISGELGCYYKGNMIFGATDAITGRGVAMRGRLGEGYTKAELGSHDYACNHVKVVNGVIRVYLKDGIYYSYKRSEDETSPNPEEVKSFNLEDSEGNTISTIKTTSDAIDIFGPTEYFEYLDKFFFEGFLGEDIDMRAGLKRHDNAGSFVSTDGDYALLIDNPFLKSLANRHKGSAKPFISKPGVFWQYHPRNGYDELAGLYFEEKGKSLIRFDKVGMFPSVSPDGCTLVLKKQGLPFLGVLMPTRMGDKWFNEIYDLCGDKK